MRHRTAWPAALGFALALALCALPAARAQRVVTDEKAAEWLAKLRGSQTAVQELEVNVASLVDRLAGAEVALSNASRGAVVLRPRVAELARASAVNQVTLHDVLDDGTIVQAETLNVQQEVARTVVMADDSMKAARKVSDSAEMMLSLGQIRSKEGNCLDSPDATTKGGKVQMWTCLKAQPSQQWEYNINTHAIKHMHGICLAAPDPGSEGTQVLMFDCDATLKSQQFAYDEATGLLTSAWGSCLASIDPEKGTAVKLAACNATLHNQRWKVIPGVAGMRQKLDGLNKELWKMQDPSSDQNIDKREAAMLSLEEATDKFEHTVSDKAKHLIGKHLRPMARRWRQAIVRLGEAASGQDPSDSGPPALGEMLGLRFF